MTDVAYGSSYGDIITLTDIEQDFKTSLRTQIQILSFISLILINTCNGYLIYLAMNQTKTALDWMMLLDSFICILNSIVLLRQVNAWRIFRIKIQIFQPTFRVFCILEHFLTIYHFVFSLLSLTTSSTPTINSWQLVLLSTDMFLLSRTTWLKETPKGKSLLDIFMLQYF